jgi:hypothetical protein
MLHADRVSRVVAAKTTIVDGHACDDMGSSTHGMSVMGQSMAAMTNHMCITPLRPKQAGDEESAKALVAQVRAAIEKYQDYKKAVADGYVQGNPGVVQPQYHFTNNANVRLAPPYPTCMSPTPMEAPSVVSSLYPALTIRPPIHRTESGSSSRRKEAVTARRTSTGFVLTGQVWNS